MIRLVELQNWRAYRNTRIDLGARVVFLVAPNGVGKSSLVEAVRFCLLGEPPSRRARSAVRLGTDAATVSVEVSLDHGHAIRVTRTLTPTGRTSFEATTHGRELSEDEYLTLLAEHWAADVGLIDRLMFTDPALPAAKSAFPVRDHLAATLGVTPLLDGAAEVDTARKAAADRVEDLREEVKAGEADLAAAVDATTDAAMELANIEDQRRNLVAETETAEFRAAVATQWITFRDAATNYNRAVADIVEELGAVIAVDPEDPRKSVESARAETTNELSEARNRKAAEDIAHARSAGASEVLEGAADICPTCLRPLTEDERSHALAEHGMNLSRSESRGSDATSELEAAAERLELLGDFVTRLAALKQPTPPTEPDPGEAAFSVLAQLRVRESDLAEQAGRVGAQVAAEATRQEILERLDRSRAALQESANREQLLATAGRVLSDLADKVLRDRIDPLLAELSNRWKLLFGTAGLTLEPSGELTVRSDGGTLEIGDLSGGERATALLIARLLITATTTQVPTVFFDEPLEHLDPRRRAAAARTVVRAGQTGTVSQLIVTTYEDRIARQLAAVDPETVRVVHADGPRKG